MEQKGGYYISTKVFQAAKEHLDFYTTHEVPRFKLLTEVSQVRVNKHKILQSFCHEMHLYYIF